jgi:hypothetical protein
VLREGGVHLRGLVHQKLVSCTGRVLYEACTTFQNAYTSGTCVCLCLCGVYMHTKCTAFKKWYTPRPVHVQYTKPPFGVRTPEGVPPPWLRGGTCTLQNFHRRALISQQRSCTRDVRVLIWCTVHVPYTKWVFDVRAVYILWGSRQDPSLHRLHCLHRPWTYVMRT